MLILADLERIEIFKILNVLYLKRCFSFAYPRVVLYGLSLVTY